MYQGTILLGNSSGCQFSGRLLKKLKNGCAIIGDWDGEYHIVYNYFKNK